MLCGGCGAMWRGWCYVEGVVLFGGYSAVWCDNVMQ